MVHLVYTYLTRIQFEYYKSSRDRRKQVVPSIYISGTTPHCLVSTVGNVNFLGTRDLVYIRVNWDVACLGGVNHQVDPEQSCISSLVDS